MLNDRHCSVFSTRNFPFFSLTRAAIESGGGGEIGPQESTSILVQSSTSMQSTFTCDTVLRSNDLNYDISPPQKIERETFKAIEAVGLNSGQQSSNFGTFIECRSQNFQNVAKMLQKLKKNLTKDCNKIINR